MPTRKKSINQLSDQAERLLRYYGVYSDRGQRVSGILRRYVGNIQDSKSWNNAFQRGRREFLKQDPDNAYRLGETTSRGFAKADNIQVSRRQYMGLSNG